jgi:glucokinase
VLSGAGLVNLYEALCTIDGSAARALTPADVTRYAIDGTDLQCVRAFSHFCAFLGSVAGDLALTFGATGGIYVAGGILLRFKEAFASSPFRERFERKGRFAGAGQNSDLSHPRRVAGAPWPRSSAIGRIEAFSI